MNELLVFGFQASAALSAGAVLHWLGWRQLLLACIPLVLVLLGVLLWWRRTRVSQVAAANM